MTSSWLEQADISNFKNASLNEKLEGIFGKEDADQFLNPTIQEKSHNTNVHHLTKKAGAGGAQSLWYSLRSTSNNKLLKNSKPVQDFYVLTPKVNENALQRIQEYKHRIELMHRVAHINETKTKQILNHVKLPTLNGELVDNCGPKQYYIKKHMRKLPAITNSSHEITDDENKKQQSDKLITFLTENDCQEHGQFRDRMKVLGVESSIGMMRHIQPPAREKYLEDEFQMKCISYQDLTKTMKENNKKVKKKSYPSQSWQPLSLNALAEYTKTIPVSAESNTHQNDYTTEK